uniref:Retrovirus-related Pol polyprotein from transposon TNT 1-94-like beta-barrel domain-containing protein n=1 Tax=Arundo donax TaxID=35708 RepID=A0A0A9C8N2_ARUDO
MASPTSPAAASGSNPCAASTGTSSNRSGNTAWFMATRASNHMTCNRSLVSNMVPVSNQVVRAGNGEGMQVCGRGSVNTEMVVLPDVWYVPELTMNLVSVGQLTDGPDLAVMMGGSGCCVSRTSDGSVVGRAHLRSDNKYEVDFLKIQPD